MSSWSLPALSSARLRRAGVDDATLGPVLRLDRADSDPYRHQLDGARRHGEVRPDRGSRTRGGEPHVTARVTLHAASRGVSWRASRRMRDRDARRGGAGALAAGGRPQAAGRRSPARWPGGRPVKHARRRLAAAYLPRPVAANLPPVGS